MKSIEEVWKRIRSLEGDTFHTKTGKLFTFTVSGDVLRVSRTEYNLSKGNFAKGLENAPFDGPGAVQSIVRGPAYVWAILHDVRVRNDEW
ncbi:hypothetical protein [Neptunicoccus cionae]|uniref:Uncharacterized protein n=1 Tax=Neptunicoccus cionae TaxID=2035344 RepID=A0A916QZU4_9RHOB|nr:hypothetical protein [Amylibacter cionae]GGA23782.1 hypothetical protein GCM10011498_25860 [Amylibacter cionae]